MEPTDFNPKLKANCRIIFDEGPWADSAQFLTHFPHLFRIGDEDDFAHGTDSRGRDAAISRCAAPFCGGFWVVALAIRPEVFMSRPPVRAVHRRRSSDVLFRNW